MGVIYKLQSETKTFIIEKKRANPGLSCRSLVTLIETELKIKVSKSSVNAVFKEAGLSAPVGRRYKDGSVKKPEKSRVIGLLTSQLGDVPQSATPVSPERAPEPTPEPEPIPETIVQSESSLVPEQASDPQSRGGLNLPYSVDKPLPAIEPTPEPEPTPKLEPEPVPEPQIPEPPAPPVIASPEGAKQPQDRPIESAPEPPAPVIPLEPASLVSPIPEAGRGRLNVPYPVDKSSPQPETKAAPKIILEGETSGAILLKAADYLNGGLQRLNDHLRAKLAAYSLDTLAKTEAFLYNRLFEQPNMSLWTLINTQLDPEIITAYRSELQQNSSLMSDLPTVILNIFKAVRGVKIILSDNSSFYLDGQFRSIWSTPHTPYDFSVNFYKTRITLQQYFHEHAPLALFIPPGYEIPTSEFFEFLTSFNSPEKKRISSLALYGSKFEELEVFKINQFKKQHFVFGLWPWQFIQYRKVNKLGEFRPVRFIGQNKDLYLADLEMELLQPKTDEGLTLRGCAIKTSLAEKTRLIILSNLPAEHIDAQGVGNIYLQQWPYPDEAFQDHSRKIELFTYTAGAEYAFSEEKLNALFSAASSIDGIFTAYLKVLDLYLRLHCLPAGYENKDFPVMKEQFYNLPVTLKQEAGFTAVIFKLTKPYPWLQDLEYMLHRLNERQVISPEGRRWWFSLSVAEV
jgi:hypothetical protein